jgi:hypothetical protein
MRTNCEGPRHILSTAEVNNGGALPPLPGPSSRRGAKLIKPEDNFL